MSLTLCSAHVRKKFFEFANAGPYPIATEALARISEFYRLEGEICGRSWEERRAVQQTSSVPLAMALEPWLKEKLALISQKSKLAEAIRHALSRWDGLCHFLDDSRIDIDSKIVERAILHLALDRKSALFPGSDGRGEHWATIASLVETCKLNGIDPQNYLADVISRTVAGIGQARSTSFRPGAHAANPLKAAARKQRLR